MRKEYYYTTFALLVTFVYLLLQATTDHKITEYLDEQTTRQYQDYLVLYDRYKKISTIIFQTQIDTSDVKEIFKKAGSVDDSARSSLRIKLHKQLAKTYEIAKMYDVEQLHFHFANNDSFLRFHRPEKFGDNLSKERTTVKYVNDNKKPIDGFEVGKTYSGYRFVFPMIYNKEHIGSVEISFNGMAINSELLKYYNFTNELLVFKDIIDKTLYEEEKVSFAPSILENFYYRKVISENMKYHKNEIFNELSSKTKDYVYKHAREQASFSIYDEASKSILTFIKVLNPITHEVVGLFVVKNEHSSFVVDQKNYCYFLLVTATLFLMSLLSFIYRMTNEKAILNDLIEKKTAKLNESQRKMQEYIRLIDKNIITSSTDLHGKITYVSEAFSEISGYPKEELIGKKHNIIKHSDTDKSIYVDLWNTIESGSIWAGEIKNKKKSGAYYWVSCTISPNFDEHGVKTGYTAIRHDITDKKKIEELSITDGMTNIFNRRYFDSLFPKLIGNAKRENYLFCLLLLDVDHFKLYNDRYGHPMGDDVLIKVAKVLKDSMQRADDYCFRLGGEEFGVIFKSDTFSKALSFAETIRQNIINLHIEHINNSDSDYVTVSIGMVCKVPQVDMTMEHLYKEADLELYKAKKSGRNKACAKEIL